MSSTAEPESVPNTSNEKTDSSQSLSKNKPKENRTRRLKVDVPLPPPPPAPTKEILDDFYRARHLAFLRYQQNMLCVQEIISGDATVNIGGRAVVDRNVDRLTAKRKRLLDKTSASANNHQLFISDFKRMKENYDSAVARLDACTTVEDVRKCKKAMLPKLKPKRLGGAKGTSGKGSGAEGSFLII